MNWAGYFVANNSAFRAVHADGCTPGHLYARARQLVRGLGWARRWANDVVEQGGSSARCANGTTVQYNLWWEMYPHNQIQLGPSISPGTPLTRL